MLACIQLCVNDEFHSQTAWDQDLCFNLTVVISWCRNTPISWLDLSHLPCAPIEASSLQVVCCFWSHKLQYFLFQYFTLPFARFPQFASLDFNQVFYTMNPIIQCYYNHKYTYETSPTDILKLLPKFQQSLSDLGKSKADEGRGMADSPTMSSIRLFLIVFLSEM